MRLDQAESAFKRAAKARFQYEEISFGRILLVTDLDAEEAEDLKQRVRNFLRNVDRNDTVWETILGDQYQACSELTSRVTEFQPDLIVTYRGLRDAARDPIYSLGIYLDVMTQVIPCPVLVLAVNEAGPLAAKPEQLQEVMVVTDHLTGDNRIVNSGVAFLRTGGGKLFLSHVEDDQIFARYMNVIAKLPSIDTEEARADIKKQLLTEPAEFIKTCREELTQQGLQGVQVHSVVKLGHRVRDYVDLIKEHEIDLLVVNTKDEAQLAMGGMAYSLAIEVRDIPLLLL